MIIAPPDKEDIQKFWYMIDDGDKREYLSLYSSIKLNNPETKKNRISSFNETIDLIRKYAIRGDENDISRSVICGILWLDDSIAINSHRLGYLMSKCKSSINGSLQMLGYKEMLSKKQASELVRQKLSIVTNDKNEIRKWTVRSICKSEDKNDEDKNKIIPKLEEPKQNNNNNFVINQFPIEVPEKIVKPDKITKPIKPFFIISTSPIEPISQTDNNYFKKEDIIINVGFQDNPSDKLQNNELTATDVFFY